MEKGDAPWGEEKLILTTELHPATKPLVGGLLALYALKRAFISKRVAFARALFLYAASAVRVKSTRRKNWYLSFKKRGF